MKMQSADAGNPPSCKFYTSPERLVVSLRYLYDVVKTPDFTGSTVFSTDRCISHKSRLCLEVELRQSMASKRTPSRLIHFLLGLPTAFKHLSSERAIPIGIQFPTREHRFRRHRFKTLELRRRRISPFVAKPLKRSAIPLRSGEGETVAR